MDDLREETARTMELRKLTMLAQRIPDSIPREISSNHGHFYEKSRGTRCNHEKNRGCKKIVVSKTNVKHPMTVAYYFHEDSLGTKQAPKEFSWNRAAATIILAEDFRGLGHNNQNTLCARLRSDPWSRQCPTQLPNPTPLWAQPPFCVSLKHFGNFEGGKRQRGKDHK